MKYGMAFKHIKFMESWHTYLIYIMGVHVLRNGLMGLELCLINLS